ncbi:DUF2892 domain-containing protein [Synechocystis sp. B12]|nr:DUF2892 domain-containing protein [Synechocystis sp. B12]
MATNMGSIDRLIRLVIASALLYLGLFSTPALAWDLDLLPEAD